VAEAIILGGPTRSVKKFIDKLIAPGLSIKGPILEGEFPKRRKTLRNLELRQHFPFFSIFHPQNISFICFGVADV